MVRVNLKNAYTLFETCLVMALVAIFILLIANTTARKPKELVQSDAHGHYECFYDDGDDKVKYALYTEGRADSATPSTDPVTGADLDYCEFEAPSFTRYLILSAVGQGSQNDGTTKVSPGVFASTFYNSSMVSKYKLYPGKGDYSTSTSGEPSLIKIPDATDPTDPTKDEIILEAPGGRLASASNADISDILSCSMKSVKPDWYGNGDSSAPPEEQKNYYSARDYLEDFMCQFGPLCEVDNGMIKVSYCRSGENYKTAWLPLNRRTNGVNYRNASYVAESPYSHYDSATGELLYCDASVFTDDGTDPYWTNYSDLPDTVNKKCMVKDSDGNPYAREPSLFLMSLRLKRTGSGTTSEMVSYIKNLQFKSGDSDPTKNDPITNVSPGNVGNAGAILILW